MYKDSVYPSRVIILTFEETVQALKNNYNRPNMEKIKNKT